MNEYRVTKIDFFGGICARIKQLSNFRLFVRKKNWIMFQMLGGNGLFVFAEEFIVRNGHTNGDTDTHTHKLA